MSEQRRIVTPEYECLSRSSPAIGSWRWTGSACSINYPANFPKTPNPPTSVRPPTTPPAVYRPAPTTTRAPISRVPSPTTLPARSKVPTILIALAVVGLGYWFVVRR